ncbi:MAG: glycosyltransferase family 4 protein [Planctomycetota bacterium]
MKILVFSSLFPNALDPWHGIFVLERLRHLRRRHGVDAVIVAPVPYFPRVGGFGRWSRLARIPLAETIDGFTVHHPRYLVTPRVGMSLYPVWMALGTRSLVKRLTRETGAELVDAHYVYPDGVAAALVARWVKLPVVVTARGTDINLLPRYRVPRSWVRWVLGRADGLAAVCTALGQAMEELGAPSGRVRILRNGVDLDKFRPLERGAARRAIGVAEGGKHLLSVGHLIERKGHHLVIEAVSRMARRDVQLLIVGRGPEEGRLRSLVAARSLQGRVTLEGSVPHERLATFYSAADLLVLASSREGWANVLLEAMACGTPVVATRIWGTPEVVANEHVGRLVEHRDAESLAAVLEAALVTPWDRGRIRAHAEAHSWDATADGQMRLFAEALARSQGRREGQTIQE